MRMCVRLGALTAVVVMVVAAASVTAQQGLTLSVGQLVKTPEYLHQNITVRNDTQSIARVRVECGFFNKGELIATDSSNIENIAPNAAGFQTIVVRSDTNADRVECRIVEAH
jgi:hypothetical protein